MRKFLVFSAVTLLLQTLNAQTWVNLNNLPSSGRRNVSLFSLHDSLYLVNGYDGSTLYKQLWMYNITQNTWSPKADFIGNQREAGISFQTDSFGYAGLGWNLNTSSSLKDIYKYNPITDSWTLETNFPGSGGRNSFFAISDSNKLYVGGGSEGSSTPYSSQFWEYDLKSKTWSAKANLPFGGRAGGISFNYRGFIYCGLGHNGTNDFNDLWKYNINTNTWTNVVAFPGTSRLQPLVFIDSNRVVIGGGHRLSISTPLNDYFEYNADNDTWRSICAPPNAARSNTKGISIKGIGYLTCGRSSTSGGLNDLIKIQYIENSYSHKFCSNDSVIIDVLEPNASYLWADGLTDSIRVFKNSIKTFVEVQINGCLRTDTFNISKILAPSFNLAADTILCSSDSLLLDLAIANATFRWQNGSTDSTFLCKLSGLYWVDVTVSGCTSRDSIIVNLGSGNFAPFFPNDTTLCNGDSINFDFGQPNQTYLWSDSSIVATNSLYQSGLYWLEITENGCASRDSFNLTIKEQPFINLGPDTSLCEGELLGTSYSNPNTSYLWNNGSNDTSITLKTTGTYWLEVLLDGCIYRDSIDLLIKPIPSINLGPDTTICFGDTITLSQNSLNTSHLWNDSSTSQSIKVHETNNYWLVSIADGCSARDSIRIETFDSLGNSFLPQTAKICNNEVLNFQLPLQNSNYLWQDGSTNRNYSIRDSGLYFVQISNTCGSRTDTVKVTKQCECEVIIPTIFTPNNDMINDQFKARISCELETYSLEIYNRWGLKVFKSVQQKQAWDGTRSDRFLKDGIYYYVLRYKAPNRNVQTQKGSILLSR